MGSINYGDKNNGANLTTERFNGYTRVSGDVYRNGRNEWVSEIHYDDGRVEGTRTDRSNGNVTYVRGSK